MKNTLKIIGSLFLLIFLLSFGIHTAYASPSVPTTNTDSGGTSGVAPAPSNIGNVIGAGLEAAIPGSGLIIVGANAAAPTVTAAVNSAVSTAAGSALNSAVDALGTTSFGCGLSPTTWKNCAAEVYYNVILVPAGYLLGLAGLALDQSILYSIVNISGFISNTQGGITLAWETIRDLANLIFIGVLIFIAVEAVIGKGDWKKSIANIIIAALLINFSMFITEAVIDASNIVTLQFYNSITHGVTPTVTGTLTGGLYGQNSPISSDIMQDIKLTTLYNAPTGSNAAGSVSVSSVATDLSTLLVPMIMGTILMLITAFVFLTGAVLFIIRLVVLLILLILSPIAFIGSILPKLDGMVGKKWRDTLTSQAIFAPAYMIMMWISLRIASGISTLLVTSANGANIVGTSAPSISLLINYAIVITFMIASVIIAVTLGAEGASFAQKWAGAATFGAVGWGFRNTVGRSADRLAKNETFQRFAGNNIVGQYALKGTRNVAGASFDARKPLGNVKGLQAGTAQVGGFAKEHADSVQDKVQFGNSLSVGGRNAFAQRLTQGNILSRLRQSTTGTRAIVSSERVAGATLDTNRINEEITTINQNINARRGELRADTSELNQLLTLQTQLTAQGRTLSPQQTAQVATLQNDIAGHQAYITAQQAIVGNRATPAAGGNPATLATGLYAQLGQAQGTSRRNV